MQVHDAEKTLISIIIVNYNVKDLLENCLHSVYSAVRDLNHEIIVVDNNSDDGSCEMLRQRFTDVSIIENTENLGFAKANNAALGIARGKFLLLLNPDTLVQEDTFTNMISFFENNLDVGMAGCKILNPDGSFELACRRSFPSPWVSFTKLSGLSLIFPNSAFFARYNLTYLSEDETYEVDAISGSFMMLRKHIFDTIGGLDESFFMYGEDLDWCYRIQSAGWKIYYVHTTKIIHYGGESTRRSSIDAQSIFYNAMQLFVRKNLHVSVGVRLFISLGIRMRLFFSLFSAQLKKVSPVLADAVSVSLAVALAEILRFGGLFTLPRYAYPTLYIVTIIVVLLSLGISGVYKQKDYEVIRSIIGVLLSLFVLSSLTFFFKDFGFSRVLVIIESAICFLLLPGRRFFKGIYSSEGRINLVQGRPTLLVGLNEHALAIIALLRKFDTATYHIVGIIDTNRRNLKQHFEGVEVIGSTDNIGKIIREYDISDVIFAPDTLSYTEILTIISRTRGCRVHYRIVPKSMEIIVGKAGIDQIAAVPLLDIEYNLLQLSNRIVKRMFDLAFAFAALILIYPFKFILFGKHRNNRLEKNINQLSAVVLGKVSLVGYPENSFCNPNGLYLGKPGMTGLIQIRNTTNFTEEERLQLALYYLRNQTLLLDLEILIRTISILFLRKKDNTNLH